MKPFCPVCRKRTTPARVRIPKPEEIFDDTLRCSLVVCWHCGVAFDPDISERLVIKCAKCGGEEWRHDGHLDITTGTLPPLCRHCDGMGDGTGTMNSDNVRMFRKE